MINIALGRREVGKTTIAVYLSRQCGHRVYFDPRGLYPTADARDAVDVDELIDFLDEPSGGELVYQPVALQATCDSLGIALTSWVRSTPTGKPVAIVIDECSLVELDQWEWLIRCAARDRFELIFTCHRPRDLNTTIRALADTWILFRTVQPHDLKAIEDRCGPSTAAQVARLSGRQIVIWDDARGESRTLFNSDSWRVDLRPVNAPARVSTALGDRTPSLLDE